MWQLGFRLKTTSGGWGFFERFQVLFNIVLQTRFACEWFLHVLTPLWQDSGLLWKKKGQDRIAVLDGLGWICLPVCLVLSLSLYLYPWSGPVSIIFWQAVCLLILLSLDVTGLGRMIVSLRLLAWVGWLSGSQLGKSGVLLQDMIITIFLFFYIFVPSWAKNTAHRLHMFALWLQLQNRFFVEVLCRGSSNNNKALACFDDLWCICILSSIGSCHIIVKFTVSENQSENSCCNRLSLHKTYVAPGSGRVWNLAALHSSSAGGCARCGSCWPCFCIVGTNDRDGHRECYEI